MILDSRSGLLLERLRPEVETLLLEDVPDVTYEDVGGLDLQIEKIVDAVELPFLHKQLFSEYSLPFALWPTWVRKNIDSNGRQFSGSKVATEYPAKERSQVFLKH